MQGYKRTPAQGAPVSLFICYSFGRKHELEYSLDKHGASPSRTIYFRRSRINLGQSPPSPSAIPCGGKMRPPCSIEARQGLGTIQFLHTSAVALIPTLEPLPQSWRIFVAIIGFGCSACQCPPRHSQRLKDDDWNVALTWPLTWPLTWCAPAERIHRHVGWEKQRASQVGAPDTLARTLLRLLYRLPGLDRRASTLASRCSTMQGFSRSVSRVSRRGNETMRA